MAEFTLLEQLQQLKAMTVRTGAIHEAQALQLRNYPKLLKGVKSATTNVDVERKLITYECKLTKSFRMSSINKILCSNIGVWIQTLLWDETSVIFKSGRRILYDSRSQDE